MATHDEMFDLIDVATNAISHALTEGDKQGYVARWRKLTVGDHLRRADTHLVSAGFGTNESRRIELEHALIRVAMALVIHNGTLR